MKLDPKPLALLATLMLIALPLTGSPSTWLNLTLAGIAMGLIIFVIASGLTLVFGLMDVLNFGHGVFIALGAFMATTVLAALAPWAGSDSVAANLAALAAACAAGMAIAAAVGVVFERVLVRPVYGQHLKQILITMGGMIIGEELIKASWGSQLIPLPMPETLRGIFLFGDVAVEKFRLLACVIGLAINVTHLPLPKIWHEVADALGRSSLAIGLLVTGAGLQLKGLLRPSIGATLGVAFKLVLMPLLALVLAAWFGLTGANLAIVAICAAVPTSPSAYVLARQMGGDAPLLAQIITLQTILAAITMPIAIALVA